MYSKAKLVFFLYAFCMLFNKSVRGADSAGPEAGLGQELPSLSFHVHLRGFFWSLSKQNFVYPCLSKNPQDLFFKCGIFLDLISKALHQRREPAHTFQNSGD